MPHLRQGDRILLRQSLRPFCSERCKLIDLGEWASDGYVIEGDPAPLTA